MPQDLPDITITGKPGQTVKVYTTLPDGTPIGNKQTGVTKARNRRTLTLDGTYVPDPVDPPPPPPPTTTPSILGPAVASDGRANRGVGQGVNACYGVRWKSPQGGHIIGLWFNQKFGPAYSKGNGGLQRIRAHTPNAQGFPGTILAERQFGPVGSVASSPGGVEVRTRIDFNVVIPAGDNIIAWDNIDANQAANWMSLNGLYNPSYKQPGTDAVTLWKDDQSSGTWGTDGIWRVRSDETPTFQVEFADGHFEGQGYAGIIANTNIDGDNVGSGFALSGNRRLRQRLVAPADFAVVGVWLRVKRLSGSGLLYATIGTGLTGSVSVSSVPQTSKTDLNGSFWVRMPLASTVKAGPFNVDFGTDAVLDVMPIRKDGQEVSGWTVPQNGAVFADKSFDGGATWAPVYSTGTDLQMYLEAA